MKMVASLNISIKAIFLSSNIALLHFPHQYLHNQIMFEWLQVSFLTDWIVRSGFLFIKNILKHRGQKEHWMKQNIYLLSIEAKPANASFRLPAINKLFINFSTCSVWMPSVVQIKTFSHQKRTMHSKQVHKNTNSIRNYLDILPWQLLWVYVVF